MKPKSQLTPELPYLCTIRGHHIFSDGFIISTDDELTDEEQVLIGGYLIEEGFIKPGEGFAFLG